MKYSEIEHKLDQNDDVFYKLKYVREQVRKKLESIDMLEYNIGFGDTKLNKDLKKEKRKLARWIAIHDKTIQEINNLK